MARNGSGTYNRAVSPYTAGTTITETSFDKSVTLPANTLQLGDVLRIRAQGICPSTNSTDTLNIKLKIGSLIVLATGALDVNNNDIVDIIEIDQLAISVFSTSN